MSANSVPVLKKQTIGKAALTAALLYLPFVLGYLFPDTWWSSHFTAFLPGNAGVLLLLLAGFLFSIPIWDRQDRLAKALGPSSLNGISSLAVAATAAIVFGVLCYSLPLYFDFFGDAPGYLEAFEHPDKQVNHWQVMLSPNIFHVRGGERTTLNLAAILVDALGTSPQEVFRLIGAVSAALYAFISVRATMRHLKTPAGRLIVAIAFLMAPSAFVFTGHVEVYAPLWPVYALFCSQLLSYFGEQKLRRLLWMLPVIFLALKLHLASVMLVPLWMLLLVFQLAKERDSFKKRLKWKWMGLFVILPLFGVAMVIYFGVMGDHRDPRFFGDEIKAIDRLFLPLFSPEPPLDRYNLLSWNHLLDFLNAALLWSPMGLAVLVAGGSFLRRSIPWNKPEIMALGLLLLMYAGLLFLINPLLAFTFDQDLMAIPAPILGFLALVLVRESEQETLWKKMTGPAMGVVLLVLPMFYVHADPAPLSLRLESLGRHSFRTYWIRSAGDIQAGLSLIEEDRQLYVRRYRENLEALESHALPGNDLEYAVLAAGLAKHLRKDQKDIDAAETYHLLAYQYYPDLDFNLVGLVECAYFKGNFKAALPYCEGLVRLRYPDPLKSLAIGTEMAVRAGDLGRAQKWVTEYLKLQPENASFQFLEAGLRQGLGQAELLTVFGQ